MDLLVNAGLNINIKDSEDNSCLHESIKINNINCLKWLLSNHINVTMVNKNKMAAIHLAVDLDRYECLEILLKDPLIDVNQPGEYNSTPLHYAAWKDRTKCARLLLDNNTLVCKSNSMGFTPLHVSTQCSSFDTMKILINYAVTKGYGTTKDLLSKLNKAKCTPLHSAVLAGNVNIVKYILDAGADINVQQENGNTAVHMAASQGSVKMLSLILNIPEKEKLKALSRQNDQGHNVLHEAVLFDRPQVVRYLIHLGSDINEKTSYNFTSLMLAASKKSWKCLRLLFDRGSDPLCRDNQSRNILHLIVLGGANPQDFNLCNCYETMKIFLHSTDSFGCTPLHYSCQQGLIKTTNHLVAMGAEIGAKNNNQQSALHFAARCGRLNTCHKLLSCRHDYHIINETDHSGQTALHLAATNGHSHVVKFLLSMGAGVFKDIDGNTPLHLSAKNGFIKTMKIILYTHPYLIDIVDKDENTALHIAVIENQPKSINLLLNKQCRLLSNHEGLYPLEIAISRRLNLACHAIIDHERWKESMELKSKLWGCVMVGMIQMMPELCEKVLSKCITPSNHDKKDPEFYYLYDFSYLQVDHELRNNYKKKGLKVLPLFALNLMVKHDRVKCLYHPLCISYLNLKWLSYGLWIHLTSLILYCLFLFCITTFVISFDFNKFFLYINNTNNINENYSYYNYSNYSSSSSSSFSSSSSSPFFTISSFYNDEYYDNNNNSYNNNNNSYYYRNYNITYNNNYTNNDNGSYINDTFDEESGFFPLWIPPFSKFPTPPGHRGTPGPRGPPGGEKGKKNTFRPPPILVSLSKNEFMDQMDELQKLFVIIIFIFTLCHIIKEFFHICHQKLGYFIDLDNYREWLFYIFLLILTTPFFTNSIHPLQWQCGCLAVFLSWFNLLIYFQRFDSIGIYVVMFFEILKTLFKAILIFSVLIFAFGFTFYIALNTTNNPSFSTPEISLMTSTIMMLGSIDYTNNWVFPDSNGRLANKELNYFILSLFVLLMPILLINLLIGLAVGDIESVLKNAKLKRIAMQVQLHTVLELKLPKVILKLIDKNKINVYPNPKCSLIKNIVNNAVGITGDKNRNFVDNNNYGEESSVTKEIVNIKYRTKKISKQICKQNELIKIILKNMALEEPEVHENKDVCDLKYRYNDDEDDDDDDDNNNNNDDDDDDDEDDDDEKVDFNYNKKIGAKKIGMDRKIESVD